MTELTVATRWSGLEELRPHLCSFLTRRCRDESERDDLVQEALLRAALHRQKLARPERLRAWTLRIAANLVRDRARVDGRAGREEADVELLPAQREPGPLPEPTYRVGHRLISLSELLEEIGRGLEALRPADRLALEAFYVRGLAGRDVARELGVAPPLVKVRLFRARRRLLRVVRHRVALRGAGRPCVAAAG